MADHYKILGLTKTASKKQIKEAFRKLAIQFHPDKHAQSPKSARDAATLKFKQLSEAYDVLIDDQKRANYNIKSRYNNAGNSYNHHANYNSNHYYGEAYYRSSYGRGSSSNAENWGSKLDAVFRYMRTRSFLLNLTFVGILFGGTVAINVAGESLWKMQNTGKSFEEAIESIEKNKSRKDKQ